MVPLLDLWQPIAVAALLVFFVSSLLHMVFTYHRSDYKRLGNEDEVLDALRRAPLAPGHYFFPHSKDHKEMASAEAQEKLRKGPVGSITVMANGAPAMPRLLGLWFAYSLLVGYFVAYVAGRTLAPGAHYLTVFRVAGAVAFMAYGVAHCADSIWKGQSWSATGKAIVDGLLYSLVTAGAFGWLWPR